MQSKYEVDLYRCDWPQLHWKASLRRIPAIILLVLAGIFYGQTAASVLATASALSVGFGATRQVRGSRLLAMIMGTLLMAFSAWVGTLAGNGYLGVILATALWGLACGLFNVLSEDFGWIVMQAVIALLVATAFPSHGLAAGGRALLILVGGLTQMLCISLFWYGEGISRFGDELSPVRAPPKDLPAYRELWKKFRESLLFSANAFHYALRVAVTLVMAVVLDHLLQLKNGYWLPMTTVVILKPDFYRTYTGGVQRVIGTLTGVIAATVIAHVLQPQNYVLVALVGIFGYFAYAFQKANPVIFSAALTSFVVFLIALTGLPEATVTWHRLINTALGCALALLARFVSFKLLRPLMPHPSPLPAKKE
jgi:hypothetical protein